MRTTIELPDDLFKAAIMEAVRQGTTLKDYIHRALLERKDIQAALIRDQGTESIFAPSKLTDAEKAALRKRSLDRMKRGIHLGGRPLTREEAHERRPIR